MTSSGIASRYASALVDVVTGAAAGVEPKRALEELRTFEAALTSSAELRNALLSPAVTPGRKRAVIGRLADKMGLSRIVRNFLMVLTDHRRSAALPEVIHSFDVLLDERLGFAQAEVSSARELNDGQRAALSAELSRVTGKSVRAKFSVDSSLIGGVAARLGSTVYDGSVRGQLDALGRKLKLEF